MRAWHDYNKLRGNARGFMFLKASGKPLSRQNFTKQLALCLKITGLSRPLYKSHFFRVGAATFAASQGFGDTQMRALGRWNSDAFIKYIRF